MDYHNLSGASAPISTDIAIFGGGAAGITLALELRNRGAEVAVFEAGHRQSPGPMAASYDGDSSGRGYPLAGSRLRYWGGSTNHWGGWCARLTPLDLAPRPDIGRAGWPIGFEELAKFYARAEALCEISDSTADTVPGGAAGRIDDFHDAVFRFSPPTRFGQRYGQELVGADNITVYLNANLVRLKQGGQAVSNATVVDDLGHAVTVRARHFVLAMGGIENARCLMINRQADDLHPTGAGLGAFFMDHCGAVIGAMIGPDDLRYYRYQESPGRWVMPVLVPNENYLRRRACPNFFLMMRPVPVRDETTLSPEYLTGPVTRGVRQGLAYEVQANFEPVPMRQSRLELSGSTDTLGMPQIRLHWQYADRHMAWLRQWQTDLVRRLGAAGIGRFRPRESFASPLSTQAHHMGTTRMAESAATGVVDPGHRVFGCDNLCVAGSSVFPSAGAVNPTLTILAMSVRLAQILEARS